MIRDPKHPRSHATISPVNPEDVPRRTDLLHAAMPSVIGTLESGRDVLVHCVSSFHRAPAVVAALFKKICGVKAQVHVNSFAVV